jgi:hypothetical protein
MHCLEVGFGQGLLHSGDVLDPDKSGLARRSYKSDAAVSDDHEKMPQSTGEVLTSNCPRPSVHHQGLPM